MIASRTEVWALHACYVWGNVCTMFGCRVVAWTAEEAVSRCGGGRRVERSSSLYVSRYFQRGATAGKDLNPENITNVVERETGL